MRGPVSSVLVVVSLVSLFVGASDAQAGPKTFGAGDVEVQQLPKNGLPSDVISKTKPEWDVKEPRYDILGLVTIESFGPTRRPMSSLKGVLKNKSIKPVDATYKILKWDGSAWVPYKNGNVTIPVNGTASVTARVRFTDEAMFFKLEVSAPSTNTHLTKQYRKAATPKKQTFVIRYGTSGNTTEGNWVMAGVWSTENTPIDKVRSNASRLAKQMQDFGFEVQNRTKHDLHLIDGQTYRIAVYIRTSEMLEREFPTREEAVAFHDSMRTAVPDSHLTIEDIRTK